MVRVETTIDTKNHIPFSIPWASTGQASLGAKAHHAGSTGGAAARELNLSGYQLLLGCAVLNSSSKLRKFWSAANNFVSLPLAAGAMSYRH